MNTAKILMVDDHPENLFALQVILTDEDYKCIKASSGREAIKIVETETDFALILMDVQMPGMDGFETVEQIRRIDSMRHVSVIFLTANNDNIHMFKGYEVGAVDYLIKPLHPEILKAKISVFVDLHLKTKALKEQEQEMNQLIYQLKAVNYTLALQSEEKEKRSAELIIANTELGFQNEEKEKRAKELLIANEELVFQNDEKEKRAAELIIANSELIFQNEEKEKRAAELVIAIKKMVFETEEKGKRAAELAIADIELQFQASEKEKRAAELVIADILKGEVEKTMLLIKRKNKDILDSINYAKRIQQAKLPRKKDIYDAFSESFVLFKPKDIVSGDFYFFYKDANYLFIAAADSTGHGVPGALLSMIGLEKLTIAVADDPNTSQVLMHLNQGIKKSLNQSESFGSSTDGMDIAFCRIDLKTLELSFAGANRPFWLIRNGTSEIIETKGTKGAVGGTTLNNQHFESHKIQLQKGDTFYIFSDGYSDTFGGKAGKKLTSRKFRQLLLDIQEKSMMEQEKHLENFLENWVSGIGQVDDILILGVRI
ncbi:MAG: response regulator [Bacteroidia bacterium]